MDDMFAIVNFEPGTFCAENYFYSSFYKVARSSTVFKGLPDEWVYDYLTDRKKFIFDKCKCIALVDKKYPEIVISFIFYRLNGISPVIYFAYTKQSVRERGFLRQLLQNLGVSGSEKVMVSYVGYINGFLTKKVKLLRVPI